MLTRVCRQTQLMLRRLAFASFIAIVTSGLSLGAWLLAQSFLGFKPYGDPPGRTTVLHRTLSDGNLFLAIGTVGIILVCLHLPGSSPFGFLHGLWRGAVASAVGPLAYVLPNLIPSGGSQLTDAGVVVPLLVLETYAFAIAIGEPLFVAVTVGLVSTPFKAWFARQDAGRRLTASRAV